MVEIKLTIYPSTFERLNEYFENEVEAEMPNEVMNKDDYLINHILDALKECEEDKDAR